MVKRNQKPERLIQDTIETWLAFRRDLIAMPIDNISRYNPTTHSFRPKKGNRGALFYRGIPDIIVFHAKLGFVGIEVKSKKGVLTPEQKDIREALGKIGGRFIVVRSLQEVMDYFGATAGLEPAPTLPA